MVDGIRDAVDCIEGMVNVCLNLQSDNKLNRKELKKYVDTYKRLIYGEKGRQTKYWFMVAPYGINQDLHVIMVFAEQCYPEKYSIKDKKIWWITGFRYGKHEDELFETYDEAKKYLKEILQFQKKEIDNKLKALDTIPKGKENSYENQYSIKKPSDYKKVQKCGCEY